MILLRALVTDERKWCAGQGTQGSEARVAHVTGEARPETRGSRCARCAPFQRPLVDPSLCAADDEERPFVCEECQAAFKRACELGNHKRGHAREKLLSKG